MNVTYMFIYFQNFSYLFSFNSYFLKNNLFFFRKIFIKSDAPRQIIGTTLILSLVQRLIQVERLLLNAPSPFQKWRQSHDNRCFLIKLFFLYMNYNSHFVVPTKDKGLCPGYKPSQLCTKCSNIY